MAHLVECVPHTDEVSPYHSGPGLILAQALCSMSYPLCALSFLSLLLSLSNKAEIPKNNPTAMGLSLLQIQNIMLQVLLLGDLLGRTGHMQPVADLGGGLANQLSPQFWTKTMCTWTAVFQY